MVDGTPYSLAMKAARTSQGAPGAAIATWPVRLYGRALRVGVLAPVPVRTSPVFNGSLNVDVSGEIVQQVLM